MVLYILGMANAWLPVLRFTSALANIVVFGMLQFVPLALLLLVVARGTWWTRVLWALVLAPVLLFSLLASSCAALEAHYLSKDGIVRSFARLKAVPLTKGELAIYRTNGGATSSYGIVIRQECRIFPGMLWVRHVWGFGPASDVKVDLLAPLRVRLTLPPYGQKRPAAVTKDVDLQPMWACLAGE